MSYISRQSCSPFEQLCSQIHENLCREQLHPDVDRLVDCRGKAHQLVDRQLLQRCRGFRGECVCDEVTEFGPLVFGRSFAECAEHWDEHSHDLILERRDLPSSAIGPQLGEFHESERDHVRGLDILRVQPIDKGAEHSLLLIFKNHSLGFTLDVDLSVEGIAEEGGVVGYGGFVGFVNFELLAISTDYVVDKLRARNADQKSVAVIM